MYIDLEEPIDVLRRKMLKIARYMAADQNIITALKNDDDYVRRAARHMLAGMKEYEKATRH